MLTLASDFGDPYPAAMRGVVHARTETQVVDVTHDLPRQDVRAGAFWLRFLLPSFPPAVHCCVVDPGVGTDRGALVVRAGDHALVGPDNGLLLPPARALLDGGDTDTIEVFEWHHPDPASSTFHGRDVFAPAAATVHEAGVDQLETLDRATPTGEYVERSLPEPTVDADGASAEVLVVDDFGNCITNLPGRVIEPRMGERVRVDGVETPVGRTFAAVDPGERLLTVGSHGMVECDVNQGRGDEAFGLTAGTGVRIDW